MVGVGWRSGTIHGWTDGRMDGCVDPWMVGWTADKKDRLDKGCMDGGVGRSMGV